MIQQTRLSLESSLTSDYRWPLFSRRWPGWRILYEDLPAEGGETIVWGHKLIILDWAAPHITFRTAHAIAHLELHMAQVILSAWFTERQERQADEHANLWLSYYPGRLSLRRPERVGAATGTPTTN